MSTFPARISQISRSDTLPVSPPALFNWSDAAELRRAAIDAGLDFPPYLFAPEVGQLLARVTDLRQRLLFELIWNTGARTNEALAVAPADLHLEGTRPFVVLTTLKQRRRGRGRPRKDAPPPKRAVPLSDQAFIHRLREYLDTFRPLKYAPLWDISDDTARNWLKRAVSLAERDGVTFRIRPITPRTLRHSYAMHLIHHHIPLKVIQAFMGHRELSSTEVYTRVFALDVGRHYALRFTYNTDDI